MIKAIYLIHSDPIYRNTKRAIPTSTARDVAVLADYYDEFFFSKFIFWGFQAFSANRVPGMLIVLPLYTIYHTVMSVSVNCFNFSHAPAGKFKCVNSILMDFFAALPALFVIAYVYGDFQGDRLEPDVRRPRLFHDDGYRAARDRFLLHSGLPEDL